jgi:hypothetical protein
VENNDSCQSGDSDTDECRHGAGMEPNVGHETPPDVGRGIQPEVPSPLGDGHATARVVKPHVTSGSG